MVALEEGNDKLLGINKLLCCPFKSCNKPIMNTTRFMPITRKEKYDRDKILRNQRKKIGREKGGGYSRLQQNGQSSATDSYSPPRKVRRYNQNTTSNPHFSFTYLPRQGRSASHGYIQRDSQHTYRSTYRREAIFTEQPSVRGR